MEEAAATLGIGLEGSTREEHNLTWALHRQTKKDVAEAMEHALDAAMAAGGTEAETLLKIWRSQMGNELAVLDRITLRSEPIPEASNNKSHHWWSLRDWQEALEACFVNEDEEDPTRNPFADFIGRIEVSNLASQLGELAGGTFAASDVMSFFSSHGATLEQSREMAAKALRYWHQQGVVYFRQGVDAEAVFDTVAKGMSEDTRIQSQVWGHSARIVPVELLEREQRAKDIAENLGKKTRQKLTIDLSGLTDEQKRAASLIGEGHGLAAIQGVAGAGKSHLLKPVVEAARRENVNVYVLGRNAKLAHELGAELGVESYTLAMFRTKKPTINKPTLLIIDEAGVVDQGDWLHMLEVAEGNEDIQLVGVGDRLQAQPIDKLGTWATICEAAHQAGVFTELTQSFRCKAWAEEAEAIRVGDEDAASKVANTAKAEGRIITADIRSKVPAAQQVAKLVMGYAANGEDVLAIAATNEDASDIAEAIQTELKVEIDSRTTLRWGKKTGLKDVVRTRKNEHHLGIRNGDRWTVTAIDNDGLTIQRADGHEVTVTHEWAKDWLELGRAATVDSAQGATVDRAVVLVKSMGKTRLYSGATRGRQAPVYVVETDSWSSIEPSDQAFQVLTAVVQLDDTAETPTEIVGPIETKPPQPEQAQVEQPKVEASRRKHEKVQVNQDRAMWEAFAKQLVEQPQPKQDLREASRREDEKAQVEQAKPRQPQRNQAQVEASRREHEQAQHKAKNRRHRKHRQPRPEQAQVKQAQSETSHHEQAQVRQPNYDQARVEASRRKRRNRRKHHQPKPEQAQVEQPKVEASRREDEKAQVEQVKARQPQPEQPQVEAPYRGYEQAQVEQPQIEQIQAKQPEPEQAQFEAPRKEPEFCKVDLHEMGAASWEDLRKALNAQDQETVKSWTRKILEMMENVFGIRRQRAEQERRNNPPPPERQNLAPRRRL
jgi:hypothetical protein